MAASASIVQRYQEAIARGDFAAARTFMRDDMSFHGPLEAHHRPEPFLESLKLLQPIIERIEPRRTFADGDDVCILYDMVTNTPAGTALIAEWYQVKGGKIAEVRAVFDARPFAALFAGSASG